MKSKTAVLVICSIALQVSTLVGYTQVVRVQFTGEVTNIVGSLLSNVTVGTVITGHVEVDLARLPADVDPNPDVANYSYSGGRAGYVFQFNTGDQTITYDSISAAGDPGVLPTIYVAQLGDPSDHIGFQARNAGSPYAAILSFDDIMPPLALLTGDYFPEDVHLDEGLARAMFQYFDNFGSSTVEARVTSAMMTIVGAETPSALLIFRVNASTLSPRQKRMLLRILRAADRAYANDRCEVGQRRLRHFQRSVRVRVRRHDRILANHLVDGARAVIDAGCAASPGIVVY
jgi:hypothetical protein